MATDQSYAVIFDKSGDLIMLFTNPKYDKSDDILLAMGYKPAAKTTGAGKGSSGSGDSGKSDQEKSSPRQEPVKSNETNPKK